MCVRNTVDLAISDFRGKRQIVGRVGIRVSQTGVKVLCCGQNRVTMLHHVDKHLLWELTKIELRSKTIRFSKSKRYNFYTLKCVLMTLLKDSIFRNWVTRNNHISRKDLTI